MSQPKTRIRDIFDALNTNPNAFSLAHGFNVPFMYGFVEGKRNPGYETLVNICAAEPRISAEYLLRGMGEPLLTERQAASLSTANELKSFKAEINRSLDARIAELENQTSR